MSISDKSGRITLGTLWPQFSRSVAFIYFFSCSVGMMHMQLSQMANKNMASIWKINCSECSGNITFKTG